MDARLDALTRGTPGCDDEVGLAAIAELVEAGTIEDDTMVYSDQVRSPPVSTPRLGQSARHTPTTSQPA